MAGNVRKHASWMVQFDERILEFLRVEGARRLYPLEAGLRNTADGFNYPTEYVLYRCKRLRHRGLIEYGQNGEYRITLDGKRFLRGDLDVAKTPPDASKGDTEVDAP